MIDVAAELAHGDVEGDARARRGLLEDHRQRLAGERPLVRAGASAFMARASIDHPAQVLGRDVDQIEEMADRRHLAPPLAWRAASCAARSSRRAGAVEPGDALGDLRLADDQRRQQPHDVVAGGDGDHLLGAQRIDELAGRHHRAQADQQALAAHLRDDAPDSGP